MNISTMELNVIILMLTGCVLLTTLLLFSRRRRKTLQDLWPEQEDPLKRIAALKAQFPSPADQQACQRIEEALKAVSRTFTLKTTIAPKRVYAMAADLTRAIAAVYYPDAKNPVLEVSLADLLKLDERIVARLSLKVQEFPLSAVKDISIQKILAGKDYYDTKIKNKLEWIKKYKLVYTLGNHAWLGYNALNPWYWGRRLAYTSAREITFRYLLTWVVTIVGEEAMAVYGRQDINTSEAVFERDLAFAMVDMALAHPDISVKTQAVVLDHVLNKARLNDPVRINVLRALVAGKAPGEPGSTGTYTKKQARRFLAHLQKVAAADGEPSPQVKEKLEAKTKILEA
jgi:hypothetical protein